MTAPIGVIEGFFGPEWPWEARRSLAPFLKAQGGDFYLYAPKRDQHLRKAWREDWSPEYCESLATLSAQFRAHGVRFGVGLSPFAIGSRLKAEDRRNLEQKIDLLESSGVDLLGIFFDDMHKEENLARTQLEVVRLIRERFSKPLLFCPSYYSEDPILDRVFGERPPGYLEEIAGGIDREVEIIWTGPKVISPDLTLEYLEETASKLGRRPFLWENLYANDGPRNCNFLKVVPYSGRPAGVLSRISGAGFNLMNQAHLSRIAFLSAKRVLLTGCDPVEDLKRVEEETQSPDFAAFLRKEAPVFASQGLSGLGDSKKQELLEQCARFSDPSAREIADWLRGEYSVGAECLTD